MLASSFSHLRDAETLMKKFERDNFDVILGDIIFLTELLNQIFFPFFLSVNVKIFVVNEIVDGHK